MIQYTMLWKGKMSKTSNVQDKDRGTGTIYQIKAELIAVAIVTIFRVILKAAATVTVFGNNSSCYGPQPWELRPVGTI